MYLNFEKKAGWKTEEEWATEIALELYLYLYLHLYLYLFFIFVSVAQNVIQLVRVGHIWPTGGADENKNYLKLIFQPLQYLSCLSSQSGREDKALKAESRVRCTLGFLIRCLENYI